MLDSTAFMMGQQPSARSFDEEVERRAYRQRLDAFISSREAGVVLTSEALADGITLSSVIDAASDVARYADEAIEIVRDEYHPPLDCREGCSYCCRKPGVLITVPELLSILDYAQATHGAEAMASLRQRARQYVSRLAGRSFDEPTADSVPCPLLVDGRCSIYPVRPLTCRGYNSTDVDACRSAHDDPGVLVPIFAVIKDVTDGATVGSAAPLRDAGFDDALVDLGTALDIALGAGDRFSAAILAGSAALAPARNSTWVENLWTEVRQTALRVGVECK